MTKTPTSVGLKSFNHALLSKLIHFNHCTLELIHFNYALLSTQPAKCVGPCVDHLRANDGHRESKMGHMWADTFC